MQSNPRRIANLYADLRQWQTRIERLPPTKEGARGTVEKTVGSLNQRTTITYVFLLGNWIDIEQYMKLERRLPSNNRDALILIRTTPRQGPSSLPKTIGALMDAQPSHSSFADIWEALEIIESELTTLNDPTGTVLHSIR